MSRLSAVSGRESLQSISMDEDVNKNLLDENVKKDVKDATDLSKIEKLNSETTAHKAGRIIAGILGGLLLAAGIAAAAVAVTATLGVAVGVLGTVAAFAGITATSIAAGAAGTAGIALIATSAHMAPAHPEVPSQHGSGDAEKVLEEKKIDFLKKGVSEIGKNGAVKFAGDDVVADTAVKMKKLYIHYDPEVFNGNAMSLCMAIDNKLKNSDGDDLISTVRDNKIDLACANFVEETLSKHDINSKELNAENILTVRRSLQEYFASMSGNNQYGELANKLNNGYFQQKFAEALIQTLGTQRNESDRKAVEIFIAAIAISDLDELDTAFTKEENNLVGQRIFG